MTARLPHLHSRLRRARVLTGAAGVVAVVLAGSAAGAAPPVRVARAATPLATFASLNACSVAPGGTRGWAVGYYSHGAAQLAYAAHAAADGRWTSVAVTKPAAVYLQGVAAASPTSIWAVGDRTTARGEAPVIEHSSGGRFTRVTAKLGMGSLQAVAASSPSNVWAVGTHPTGRPLVARWVGRRWQQVALGDLPAGTGGRVQLVGVATSGPGNVWLVGETSGGPMVASWTGHSFGSTVLTAPAVVAGMVPTAITTTAASNVWIAGYVPGPAASGGSAAATSHDDGSAWAPVAVTARGVRNVPSSIVAVGASVYLVGYTGPKSIGTSKPLVLERTGSTWRKDAVAKVGHNGVLLSVCASSRATAAVGAWYAGAAAGPHRRPPHPLVVVRHVHAWRRPPS